MKHERSRRSPSPDKPTSRPHKEEITKVRYYIKHDGKYVKSIGISTSYQGMGGLRYTVGYSNKENGMYAYSLELAESISKSIGGYYEKDRDGADKVMSRVMYYVREDKESGLGEDIRYFTNKEEADRFAKEYEKDYGEKIIVGKKGDEGAYEDERE